MDKQTSIGTFTSTQTGSEIQNTSSGLVRKRKTSILINCCYMYNTAYNNLARTKLMYYCVATNSYQSVHTFY